MGLVRPSVLWFALLMTAPALYRYVTDDLDITSLLARFLIAVMVAATLLAGLRFVTDGYGEDQPAVPMTPKPDRPSLNQPT